MTVAGVRHELRAMRASITAASAPHFGLYRCAPDCASVATLRGGIGVTDTEVTVALPLTALGVGEGAALTAMRAFAGVGEATIGVAHGIDDVPMGSATVPARTVAVGLGPAGGPEHEVAFGEPLTPSTGSFTATVPAPEAPGPRDAWARVCLGEECRATRIPLG